CKLLVIPLISVLFLTLLLLFLALFPGAFDCCTKISDEIPKGILRRVVRFEIQKADGLCHLEAVILHMKGKKFCVNPWNKKVKKMMKKMKHKIHRSKFHVRNQRKNRITKQKEQKQ
ncbi:CCL28 protein, partial [Melanocharis versteri]|nr:CCL28 protein [Melanocharis versteri]